jgi:chromosome segregation ATPase
MTTEISSTRTAINRGDIEARIEELEGERETLQEAIEEAKQERADLLENIENCKADNEGEERSADTREALRDAKQALRDFDEEGSIENAEFNLLAFNNDESGEGAELAALQQLLDDMGGADELINDDYFTDYIEELIKDCYPMPEGFDEGAWPWRHMAMDYESAADEAKQDYSNVEFNGQTFWAR